MRQYIEYRIQKEVQEAERVPIRTGGGGAKAWDTLARLRPQEAARAGVP